MAGASRAGGVGHQQSVCRWAGPPCTVPIVAGVVRNPVFAQLLEAAIPAVLNRSHERDARPVEGGRWPVTIIARPPVAARSVLQGLMREALEFTGPGHFVTGRADSVHVTIRALEPYREAASPTDPVVEPWRSAMERACAATPPFDLHLTGVTLSPSGVIGQLETVDDAPWRFAELLRRELGDLAWFEDRSMRRDIWYATLIHFADDIVDPPGLVDWVRSHLTMEPPVDFSIDTIELVRSRYVAPDPGVVAPDRLMRPETWCAVSLTG